MKKYEFSNKIHRRLSNKHNDNANKYKDTTSKNFWSLAKRDYHDLVIRKQNESKRILSKKEKNGIYKSAVSDLVDYRKSVNEYYGFKRYIPKSLKK